MKIFLTGAAGYIGGEIATRLRDAGHRVSGLVRPPMEAYAEQLHALGVEPVYGTLEDSELIGRLASESDAFINTANADHRGVVEVAIAAMRQSGKTLIQTSGSSITADLAGGNSTDAVYDDETVVKPVPARAARIALNDLVLAAATADGIRTMVIAPSMVYGQGSGVHKDSIQVPALIRVARKFGAGCYIGNGENRWSNVHVADLADLYLQVLFGAPAGAFYYVENGENSMREIAAAISRMLGFDGRTQSLSDADALAEFGEAMTRLSLGSNSRVRARRAHEELGWTRHRATLQEEIERGSYARKNV